MLRMRASASAFADVSAVDGSLAAVAVAGDENAEKISSASVAVVAAAVDGGTCALAVVHGLAFALDFVLFPAPSALGTVQKDALLLLFPAAADDVVAAGAEQSWKRRKSQAGFVPVLVLEAEHVEPALELERELVLVREPALEQGLVLVGTCFASSGDGGDYCNP